MTKEHPELPIISRRLWCLLIKIIYQNPSKEDKILGQLLIVNLYKEEKK